MKEDFAKGELVEGLPWRIALNYTDINRENSCKHCFISEPDDSLYTVDSAAVALNDGGCSSTAICIECLMEALETVERVVGVPTKTLAGILAALPDAGTREVGESLVVPYNAPDGLRKISFRCVVDNYGGNEWVMALRILETFSK